MKEQDFFVHKLFGLSLARLSEETDGCNLRFRFDFDRMIISCARASRALLWAQSESVSDAFFLADTIITAEVQKLIHNEKRPLG